MQAGGLIVTALLEYLDLEVTKPTSLQSSNPWKGFFLVLAVLLAIKRKILSNKF